MKYRSLFLLFLFAIQAFAQENSTIETVLQKGHAKQITCADFHPTGKYIATGSVDRSVILWDHNSGKVIRYFNHHSEQIKSIDFNSTGNLILTTSKDNTAKITNINNGEIIHSIDGPDAGIRNAYFSDNDSLFYIISDGNFFLTYDLKTGKEIGEYGKNYSAIYLNNVIRNNTVISTPNYKGAVVSNIRSGDTLLNIPFNKTFDMAISPDGKKIVIGSTKLFAKIFYLKSGKELATLRDTDAKCDGCNTLVAWSNDSKYVVTMSNKVGATLWNASNGKKIRTFNQLRKRPLQLKFSPNDAYVSISLADQVFVYNVKSGKETIHVKNTQLDYYEVNFSPDSESILLPSANNTGQYYSLNSGKRTKKLAGYLSQESFAGLEYSYSNWTDGFVLRTISLRRGFSLTPDNDHIVTGNVDSIAVLIDINTGKIKQKYIGHSQVVIATAISPDGKVLATAGGDKKIILWELSTGKIIDQLYGHRNLVFDLDFSSDGQLLTSASYDATVGKWDLKNGTFELKYVENSPYSIAFSPNDLYIIAGDNQRHVKLLETDVMEEFRRQVGHQEVVQDIDFSNQGNLMATASWDGSVKVWQMNSGMLTAKYNQHKVLMHAIDFTPDDKLIAIGQSNGSIVLWDYQSNKIIDTLSGHGSAVTDIHISADGKSLLSMSAEGMVKKWDLTTKKEAYTRIQISRDEWLSTTPDGRFDGSSNSLKMVNYVSGLKVIPINSLFKKYYTPNLISKSAYVKSANEIRGSIENEIKESPELQFILNDHAKNEFYPISDSIYHSKLAVLDFEIGIQSKEKVIDEIKFYNNGKLVKIESINKALEFRGGSKDRRPIQITLNDGENKIAAVAINSNGVESSPVSFTMSFNGEQAKTDLFLFSIGINNYKNPKYNLNFAKNDAKSFVSSLKKGGSDLFNNIYTYALNDKAATKTNIQLKIKEIEQLIGPEDVFVFYYAGHGTMSATQDKNNGEFYIVTHDVTNLYGDVTMLDSIAVSAKQLLQFSMNLDAQKQLFVLDACHSGGALQSLATRGDGREKALAQLARSTGTYFLTASQDAQYANEAGDLRHGLFTYALLEILQGTTGQSNDNKVTINEMKSYVEDRVPELSEKYHGSAQYPTSYSFGQDFPIVILK